MRPLLQCLRKRYACSLEEEMEMNLLTEWLISVVLGTAIIVVTQDISAGFVLNHPEEAEAKGIVLATTIEVVGMGVVVIGMLLGKMLLPHLSLQVGRSLPLVILHQTSCPDTPPQNGVAERKIITYWRWLEHWRSP
jgi:hypothetical protein